jgi:hypothetical protein
MILIDLFEDSHQRLMTAVQSLSERQWQAPNVCGLWSIKDIMAHLTSIELVLVDVLYNLLDPERPTPKLHVFWDTLAACGHNIDKYNRREVALRRRKSVAEVLAEYEQTHAQASSLLTRIPTSRYREKGIFWWHGRTLDLTELIGYYDGHKREHYNQIVAWQAKAEQDSDF